MLQVFVITQMIATTTISALVNKHRKWSRALRRIPPTPTYTVNRALGRWTDPGPTSAFATRDPIHIVHSTLRINPNMFMFMFRDRYPCTRD